jgi:hypothetical protein
MLIILTTQCCLVPVLKGVHSRSEFFTQPGPEADDLKEAREGNELGIESLWDESSSKMPQ